MAFLSFPYGWPWDAPPPPPESVRVYGRTDGRSYADVITKISRVDGLPIFLTHGASLARFARWSAATKKMKNLLPVIRRHKHKGKRAHARTSLQLWMRLIDLDYNFECDSPIELSDNKLFNNKVSNNKLSDSNLVSKLTMLIELSGVQFGP